jgi:serine/threonine protein kinase
VRDVLDKKAGLHLERLQDADLPVKFGRFVLRSVLGEGAMGRVFKAELTGPAGFRKPTAIKVMRKSVGADAEEYRQALVKEARIGAMLKHRNIVEVYDFGEIGRYPFISMELVDGVGLDRILKSGPLPASQALDLGIQLCAGLDNAHCGVTIDGKPAPVVHRDLKPSNILLDQDGVVRIMDFGIAKAAVVSGIVTATGMTRGTPSYMSPEQVRGKKVDGRSDLFAVGTVLFEMLTGLQLFRGRTLLETLNLIAAVEARLARPEFLAPAEAVVPGMAGVLRRCLRAEATKRFRRARDMVTALAALRDLVPTVGALADRVHGTWEGPVAGIDVEAETRASTAAGGPGRGSTVPSAPALPEHHGLVEVEPYDSPPPARRTDEIASLGIMEALEAEKAHSPAPKKKKPFRLVQRVPKKK